MPIFEITPNAIKALPDTTFGSLGLRERHDIQRLLRERIDVIAPHTLVISEEFGEWEDSRRRIDILAVDKDANLVVIELKRTEDGGHMELQAIRYAAMVSLMTFDKAIDVYSSYLKRDGKGERDARAELLEFLQWDDVNDDKFAQEVRIVLVSAEFNKEITSSVLWLNDYGLDIRCVRLKPYHLEGRVLVDVEQIIPLREAEDYQIQIRKKNQEERHARVSNMDFTRYDVRVGEEQHEAMWKRNAIFFVCKYLVEHGVAPDDINKPISWRPNRLWRSVDGEVKADEFERLVREKSAGDGPAYTPGRWYTEDNELVRFGGKTYAFSNQWGGDSWLKAMEMLKETYPQFGIAFKATAQ